VPLVLPPPPPPIPAWVAPEADVGDDTSAHSAAFHPGDLEFKLRTAFNGFGAGPLSLLLSVVGWNELQLCADFGVVEVADLTLGVGVEAFYSRPWLLELLSEGLVDLLSPDEVGFDWRAQDYGAAARGTLHYAGMDTLDFYGLFLAGPRVFTLDVSLEDEATAASGSYRTGGLKFGVGGGVNAVARSGLMGGVELRYLFGFRFREAQSVTLTDSEGTETEVFEMTGYTRPPRGFSWVLYLGYRI